MLDRVRNLALGHQDKFKFLLFTGATIAGVNCLARPDYNLILYLYAFYIWHMFEIKVKFIFKKF
jgi:hypothetical protein